MFRRREPLHERLAREGGLLRGGAPPHEPGPGWAEAGIHGVARPREWDVVTVAEAPPFGAEAVTFVALPGGTLLTDDDAPDEVLEQLAAAVEGRLDPPYRAEAVRRDERRLAVAARAIEVTEVEEEIDGEAVELTVYEGERELRVDGEPVFGSVRALEAYAERRFRSYVLRAQRLDGTLWEIHVAPL